MSAWAEITFGLRYALKHPGVRTALRSALGSGLLCLLTAVVFWWPVRHEHEKLRGQIEARLEAEQEAEHSIQRVRLFQQLSERVGVLETKWGATASQAEWVRQVARLSQKNGLRVLSETFEESTLKDRTGLLLQETVLSGDYPSVRRFLLELDGLPTLTIASKTRLDAVEKRTDRIQASLKLSTYQKQGGRGGRGSRP